MVTAGIDPGSRRMGYGIVRKRGAALSLVRMGTLEIFSRDEGKALVALYDALCTLFSKHRPDVVAVEKLYLSKNRKTAMEVAQARGIALLVAKKIGARIVEYTPSFVKSAFTGDGRCDKKAMRLLAEKMFPEKEEEIQSSLDDAIDALALAVVASFQSSLDSA